MTLERITRDNEGWTKENQKNNIYIYRFSIWGITCAMFITRERTENWKHEHIIYFARWCLLWCGEGNEGLNNEKKPNNLFIIFMARYFIIIIYHNLFNYSPYDGHPLNFQLFATTKLKVNYWDLCQLCHLSENCQNDKHKTKKERDTIHLF